MKIRAINQIFHKGNVLPPGTEFELEDEFVESLLDINAVELINEESNELDVENMTIEQLLEIDINNLKQLDLINIAEKFNIVLKGARSNKDKAKLIIQSLEELLKQGKSAENDDNNLDDKEPNDKVLDEEKLNDEEEPMTGMPED